MPNRKNVFTITFISIIIINLLTSGALYSPSIVEAQGLQLRVSAAERPQFQNHFFGPQIVQVVIDDPGATDPDESTVGLQVMGKTVPRVHLSDGLWYHFFAEENTFGIFLDVITDGARDNRIEVKVSAADLAARPAGFFPPVPPSSTVTIGAIAYTVDTAADPADTFVREISVVGGTVFAEVDSNDIFPTLPAPFFEGLASTINPDIRFGTNTCDSGELNLLTNGDCDWPYIRLIGINELDIVAIRAGSASVNLIYDDFNESISSLIDRTAAYPIDAEVIVSYTDFMWNINPVEEDVVHWVLEKETGLPTNVLYRPVRSFTQPTVTPDLLPVLFRPSLNFDTRQVLELDAEGVNTLKFNGFFDPITGTVGNFGFPTTADNARIVDTSPFALPSSTDFVDLQPVITMIESDPNTSFFESIDEQQGSRSNVFTGVNDKVANFDYFDIINSAIMTFHDGFVTVDREVYDSADRAVFTVTDPDQNLRSRVSEQPSAVRSNSFMKVGNPFPLGNNPTFPNFFGKNTLPAIGKGNDMFSLPARQGIEEVHMLIEINRNTLAPTYVDATTGNLQAGITIDGSGPIATDLKSFIVNALNTGTAGGVTNADIVITGSTTTPVTIRINKFPSDSFSSGAGAVVNADDTLGDVSHFVVLDRNNNGIIDLAPGAKTNDALFIATNDDVRKTFPDREQTIGLNFVTRGLDNPAPTPDDRPSAILINTEVTLQDLNRFTEFTATGFQIRANNAGIPVITATPAGQAFPVDPFVAATALFVQPPTGIPTNVSTHASANIAGVNALTAAQDAQVFKVMVPEYNLLHANLQEVATQMESGIGGLNFDKIAIQISIDSRNVPGATGKVVTRMVDFTPFGNAAEGFTDVDPTDNSGFVVDFFGATKIGTGSFRIVDFFAADWNGNGTPWPVDQTEEALFNDLKLQVTVVFINSVANEPVEVIGTVNSVTGEVTTSHVAAIDFSGITTVIPPPTFIVNAAGSTTGFTPSNAIPSFPAQRTIDEITMLAKEHVVYRVQVKEEGSNSSVYTGRMDFMTVNQFDTTQKALSNIVFSGDPAKALMPNRFIPPNRLSFSYSDIDIVQSFRASSATFIYETRDGKIFWDSKSYSFGSRAIITLEDQDLNRRPDAIERYDLPVAGFIFFELGKKRVDDACTVTVAGCFLAQVDATLMETGPNTGIFQAQIEIPSTIRLTDGTVASTRQDDLEVNYVDIRDRSSIRQEFDDITNVRTKLGNVLLDRGVYPQGPRLPPNEPLLGAIVYISIVDSESNTDVDIRESLDLISTVDFSSVTGTAGDIRDIFEIKIFNGGGINPVVYSANPLSSFLLGGNAFPIIDRNGNTVTEALESGPNTGIFELEFMIYCPDSTPLGPFLPAPICTDTIFDELTRALGLPPLLTFKANSRIVVTFNDPADDSGTPQDVNAFAVIQGVTAQIGTDKTEYNVGDPATFFMIEPDFNFDSRAVEQVDFNFIGITTDKTPIDEVPLGFLLNALHAFGSFSSSEAGFRESDLNSGIFGAIAKPGVVDTLVANRGSIIELVYRDFTPSGGGSPIRIEYNIFLNANTPEIIFDREEYTPFDEVIVSIISPDSNFDPFQIDTINPSISTSSDRGFRLKMSETGPDSRIFEQDVRLTPDRNKFPGDLIAQREDGLTVEFRIDSRTVVTKSVFINYHVGNVMFDKDAFRTNDRAIVRIIDPDENRNPDTIDTIGIRVWSTTDRGGLFITLRETGDRTGIFEEFLTFTTDEESSGTRLRVSEGDTIVAKYSDRTLPAPAALDGDGIFTVEIEELFASALIGSAVPPLERAVVTQPKLVDQSGSPIEQIKVNTQVLIQSEITNNQNVKQKFVYIVQIKDSIGITRSLPWLNGELPPKDSVAAAQSWVPERQGSYQIEVFVWESIDSPTALSYTRTIPITVS
jgi:hypothetical protein